MALVADAQQSALIRSPDVGADGRVTFRFCDPNARAVLLHLENTKDPIPMQKEQDCVWQATTGKLDPNIYSYSFEADEVELLDPSNSKITPNLFHPASQFLVPGQPPRAWELTDVPHGVVHRHWYGSAIASENRDYYVYTPPNYDPRGRIRYPVLYLLHGYSDDASGWTAVGKANLILDSLIAAGKARPMIIVMPLGYGAPEIVERTAADPFPFRQPGLREKNFRQFTATLLDEVMPVVEKQYRIETGRESRAIAGLSMGGTESLLTGLGHLDRFAWIGSFSAGGLGENFDADFPRLSAADNAKIKLLYVSCGTEDHLVDDNRKLVAWLKSKDVRVAAVETPGMHAWPVWRGNLIAFASQIFGAAQ